MHLSLKGSVGRQLLAKTLGDKLLVNYPGARAAYSFRDLTGNGQAIVRVRRSSDNTERDFTADGVRRGDLESFCGTGTGFVVIWYDQSGNNQHAEQSTLSQQGKIVKNGTLVLNGNGNVSLIYDDYSGGMLFPVSGTNKVFFTVFSSLSNSGQNIVFGFDNLAKFQRNFQIFRNSDSSVSFIPGDEALRTLDTTIISTNGDYSLFSNGTLEVSNTFQDPVNTASIGDINKGGAQSSSESLHTEYVIYDSAAISNRLAIEANINNFYKLY